MENVEVKQKIKNSDDGKGILITNDAIEQISNLLEGQSCLLYTSPSPRDLMRSRMPSSA